MAHDKTQGGRLTWAGVVLCDFDEDPDSISDVELDRRFDAAQAAACRHLRDAGYLPLVSRGSPPDHGATQDQELWDAVLRHGIE